MEQKKERSAREKGEVTNASGGEDGSGKKRQRELEQKKERRENILLLSLTGCDRKISPKNPPNAAICF